MMRKIMTDICFDHMMGKLLQINISRQDATSFELCDGELWEPTPPPPAASSATGNGVSCAGRTWCPYREAK